MIGHQPSSISTNRGVFGVGYTPIESNKPVNSNDPSKESYPVKPFGYPKLPFPEAPLGRAVTLLGRMKLSNRRLARPPLADYRSYRRFLTRK